MNSLKVIEYRNIRVLTTQQIADAHELVDCYEVPTYLEELITDANAQMGLGVA